MGAVRHSVEEDLAALSRIMARLEHGAKLNPSDFRDERDPVFLARTMFLQRRQRAQQFGDIADLLHEPAWDILLNLYAAEPDGLRASTAATVAGVPHTTGLRYLATLEARGLVRSDTVDNDRRCRFVRLSDDARDRLTAHLLNRSRTAPNRGRCAD